MIYHILGLRLAFVVLLVEILVSFEVDDDIAIAFHIAGLDLFDSHIFLYCLTQLVNCSDLLSAICVDLKCVRQAR